MPGGIDGDNDSSDDENDDDADDDAKDESTSIRINMSSDSGSRACAHLLLPL